MPTRPSRAELDAWVLASAPQAMAFARSLLGDPHQADDIVQDCYCRLLAKADVYDLPRDGLKLLLTAVSNASINLRTRRRPWLRLARADDDDSGGVAEPADPREPLPADALAHAELQQAVTEGLGQLPERQRAALELKALGYSQQEVGDMLGITASNAGVLIHRARSTLARILAPHLGGEPVE